MYIHIYIYVCIAESLCSTVEINIINQLYFNKFFTKFFKMQTNIQKRMRHQRFLSFSPSVHKKEVILRQ